MFLYSDNHTYTHIDTHTYRLLFITLMTMNQSFTITRMIMIYSLITTNMITYKL